MQWVKAKYKNDDFLRQVEILGREKSAVHLWWLGQSGFLLQCNGIHLLIDPYLSESLTKKYLTTAQPHTRMCDLVIDPARLNFIDIITSSHNHTDHLDGDTLVPLTRANPSITLLTPEANREFVSHRINMPLTFTKGLNDGQAITICGITFHGISAAHNELDRDDNGNCRYMGYVIEIGHKKIYHSGDTLLYPGIADILKPFKVDLAILPINGNDPSRGVAGNLNAGEAAWLAKEIGAGLTIPCHYDLFTFNTADVSEFVFASEQQGIKYSVLELGDSFTL